MVVRRSVRPVRGQSNISAQEGACCGANCGAVRLFFAILLPEEVREELSRVQAEIREAIGREGVRWEDPRKFHITLRFLGEIAEAQVEEIKEAGREAAQGCAPFTLGLDALGAFPHE